MPQMNNAEMGSVDKWFKRAGEAFNRDETICEVTVGGVTIGMDVDDPGIIADILVSDERVVPVGTDIVVVANNRDDYLSYIEKLRIECEEKEKAEQFSENYELTHQVPSTTTLLKAIKHMVRSNKLEAGSDFLANLLSLARKGDKEVLDVFEASCDGLHYSEDSFDVDFFLENVKAVVKEHKL
eukprot:CAMPEP_0185027056 /NCGR_PEP_ID=MMETSP1103-20130426/11877_1 /TAXON_ID=36769 /ORGANISM="Paraphysomonas bandaiensis, Strain Caron Lab Isolate" /LENGTH=182 /DNA_ID=CAMNT_0027560899 /DNA_START=143 /DNA_END=691 /DNA_ORIENTATION=-